MVKIFGKLKKPLYICTRFETDNLTNKILYNENLFNRNGTTSPECDYRV